MEERKRRRRKKEEGKSKSSGFGGEGEGLNPFSKKKNHWGEFRVRYGNRYCHASIVISTTEPAVFLVFIFLILAVWCVLYY